MSGARELKELGPREVKALSQLKTYTRSLPQGIYTDRVDELRANHPGIYSWNKRKPTSAVLRGKHDAPPPWQVKQPKKGTPVYWPPKSLSDLLNIAAEAGIYREEGGKHLIIKDDVWVEEKNDKQLAKKLEKQARAWVQKNESNVETIAIPKHEHHLFQTPPSAQKGSYYIDVLHMGTSSKHFSNGGYQYLFTALNVHSRYVYAYLHKTKTGLVGKNGKPRAGSLLEAVMKFLVQATADSKEPGLAHRKPTHLVGDGEFKHPWLYHYTARHGIGVEWTERHTHEQLGRLNSFHSHFRAYIADFIERTTLRAAEVKKLPTYAKRVKGKQVSAKQNRNPWYHFGHSSVRTAVDAFFKEFEEKKLDARTVQKGAWNFMRTVHIDPATLYPVGFDVEEEVMVDVPEEERERLKAQGVAMPLLLYFVLIYNNKRHSSLRTLRTLKPGEDTQAWATRLYKPRIKTGSLSGALKNHAFDEKKPVDPVKNPKTMPGVVAKRVKLYQRMSPAEVEDKDVDTLIKQDMIRASKVEKMVDAFLSSVNIQWETLLPDEYKSLATLVKLDVHRSWMEDGTKKGSSAGTQNEWSSRWFPLVSRVGVNTFKVRHDFKEVPKVWPIYRLKFRIHNPLLRFIQDEKEILGAIDNRFQGYREREDENEKEEIEEEREKAKQEEKQEEKTKPKHRKRKAEQKTSTSPRKTTRLTTAHKVPYKFR